jgi:transposase-like protein
MPVPPRPVSPEALAEARRLYEETRVPVDDIAALLGIGARTFYTRVRKWGWRRRILRIPQAGPLPAPASAAEPEGGGAAAPDDVPTAERVQRVVERELHAVEQIVARLKPSEQPQEAERIARILASLTRTLQEVARLKATPATPKDRDDDRAPDDPDELVGELVRRMDEFARSWPGRVHDEPAAAPAREA